MAEKDELVAKIKRENSARWAAYGPGVNGMEGEAGLASYREKCVQGFYGLSQVDAIEYDEYQKEKQRQKDSSKRWRQSASK